VVDVQRDFCAGGALAVPDGDLVVPLLNRWLRAAAAHGAPVYASRDWHPRTHPSFRGQGGPWPPHCVQDSEGARFHPELALPSAAIVVTKGTRFDRDQNSAFEDTGLAEQLRRDGVGRLWVGGLALDVCVLASALDALAAGFSVRVIAAATRPVDAAAGARALARLREAGAEIEERA